MSIALGLAADTIVVRRSRGLSMSKGIYVPPACRMPSSEQIQSALGCCRTATRSSQMPVLDPMMFHMPPGGSTPNSYNFPVPSFGSCNGATGPCARHLEEIRSQLLQSAQPFPRQASRTNGVFKSPVQPSHDTIMEDNVGSGQYLRQMPATTQSQQSMPTAFAG